MADPHVTVADLAICCPLTKIVAITSRPAFWTLPLNLVYAFVLLFCVVTTYNVVNAAIIHLTRAASDSVPHRRS